MPVTPSQPHQSQILQRTQYAKGGWGRRYWDFRDRAILEFLTPDDSAILDLGCGEGITLEKIRARFPSAHLRGIDVLPENIAICRQFNLPVEAGDVYDLKNIADASQDAVLFIEVIEHLDQPERALTEIHRILKPGGKLIVVFPNDRIFKWARLATGRLKEAAFDPGHVRQWTPSDLRKTLSAQGYDWVAGRALPFVFWSLSLHGLVCARKLNLRI
jgi:SAM-dependent methyltransferase